MQTNGRVQIRRMVRIVAATNATLTDATAGVKRRATPRTGLCHERSRWSGTRNAPIRQNRLHCCLRRSAAGSGRMLIWCKRRREIVKRLDKGSRRRPFSGSILDGFRERSGQRTPELRRSSARKGCRPSVARFPCAGSTHYWRRPVTSGISQIEELISVAGTTPGRAETRLDTSRIPLSRTKWTAMGTGLLPRGARRRPRRTPGPPPPTRSSIPLSSLTAHHPRPFRLDRTPCRTPRTVNLRSRCRPQPDRSAPGSPRTTPGAPPPPPAGT